MRIINLVENIAGRGNCVPAHGLCLYVETVDHVLLMDTGPSALLVDNARALGVDLARVDAVIISHGHYDHTGGVLAFAGINPTARVYLRRGAGEDFWSASGDSPHPIGMDPAISFLPQLEWQDGDAWIDRDLLLFGGITGRKFWPAGNRKLFRKTAGSWCRMISAMNNA